MDFFNLKGAADQDHFAGPMNPDSGNGLKGTPIASAVFFHTLLEVCEVSSHARLDRKLTLAGVRAIAHEYIRIST